MKLIKGMLVLSAGLALAACDPVGPDKSRDRHSGNLGGPEHLVAGIWIDPNGCQHWIIDDGIEGYLSARLDKYGKPVCTDVYPKGYAIGSYKDGQGIGDFL